jgi:hypothetical protein
MTVPGFAAERHVLAIYFEVSWCKIRESFIRVGGLDQLIM